VQVCLEFQGGEETKTISLPRAPLVGDTITLQDGRRLAVLQVAGDPYQPDACRVYVREEPSWK